MNDAQWNQIIVNLCKLIQNLFDSIFFNNVNGFLLEINHKKIFYFLNKLYLNELNVKVLLSS